MYQILTAEINDLVYKAHNVEIYNNDNQRYTLDAVDIDNNGELLSFNIPTNSSSK